MSADFIRLGAAGRRVARGIRRRVRRLYRAGRTQPDTQTSATQRSRFPGTAALVSTSSFVNPHLPQSSISPIARTRAVQVIDTRTLTHKRRLGRFCGRHQLNAAGNVNNNISGRTVWSRTADGSTPATHSDLRVYDHMSLPDAAFKEKISTGGETGWTKCIITSDGECGVSPTMPRIRLLDMFAANGDRTSARCRST